jgi:hypothetical protein
MKKKTFLMISVILFLAMAGLEASAAAYDYPVSDPYLASIIGTPSEFREAVPDKIDVKHYKMSVLEDRKVPDLFWHEKELRFSLAYHKKKAPLIFVIAGTGASYRSAKMQLLQKTLYQAGFHVISLSSPTHPNFIVAASSTGVPGHVMTDASDLYRVMEMAIKKVEKKIEVAGYYLTGYSLGGTQAAFVSLLDETRKKFNFKKVLLINPSVNLFSSVKIIDDMLVENIPGGVDNFNAFFRDMMKRFSKFYGTMGYIDFNDDFLYRAYEQRTEEPDEGSVKALIGTSFRISSSNMLITSDAMTHAGLIIPKNQQLSKTERMSDYFKVSVRTSFIDYFNELFYPYFKKKEPGLTPETLVNSVSLESIEDYLKGTEKIGVITNIDDFILTPDDIGFLRSALGDRARIFPKGGHCGNMGHRDNIAYMIDFLK